MTNRVCDRRKPSSTGAVIQPRRYAVSHMSPLVHAIRIVPDGLGGKLDGGADPAGDGMAAQV